MAIGAGLVKPILKWLATKVIAGIKVGGKAVASGTTKALNYVTPKISNVITKGGTKLASHVTNPFANKAILSTTKLLAKDAFIRPIIKDLTFKAAKETAGLVPVVGKHLKATGDILDAVIGIPLI